MRSLPLTGRRLALAGLATAGLLSIGGPAGQAADPFVAGGQSTRPLPAAADELARARARGQEVAAALGLPGVNQRVQRLDDAFDHRTYDEVTATDAPGRALDGPGAANRAMAFARAAGLAPQGSPTVRASAGAGGWSISWARIVDGV